MKSIAAAIALILAAGGGASAMPLAPSASRTEAPIVLVRDGCGPGAHRGGYGECVPNRGGRGPDVVEPREVGGPRDGGPRVVAPVRLPPPCPRGYYRDPRPDVPMCYPRF